MVQIIVPEWKDMEPKILQCFEALKEQLTRNSSRINETGSKAGNIGEKKKWRLNLLYHILLKQIIVYSFLLSRDL